MDSPVRSRLSRVSRLGGYQIGKKLGEGSFAQVRAARHLLTDELVCLLLRHSTGRRLVPTPLSTRIASCGIWCEALCGFSSFDLSKYMDRSSTLLSVACSLVGPSVKFSPSRPLSTINGSIYSFLWYMYMYISYIASAISSPSLARLFLVILLSVPVYSPHASPS